MPAAPAHPLAHELWFVDDVPPADWSFATEPRTLALLGAALLVAAAARVVAGRAAGADLPSLARLAPWIPFAVRLHLAVSLVGLLSSGWYLAPSLGLGSGLGGWLLGSVMAAVAVLLATGWHVRPAALLLVAAGPIGMAVFGVSAILQRADVLGLALFLLIAGAGRWSADWELGRVRDATVERLGRALWALRVAAGSALIVVAFTEKLANPQLARRFVDERGVDFNVADATGLPVGDLEFIRIAGAIEVLFGLLLISGALPQVIVIAAGIPFNLTLYFFGTIEMLGHLPVYAAMLVLLVCGSSAELRPWCSRLWPLGRFNARLHGQATLDSP